MKITYAVPALLLFFAPSQLPAQEPVDSHTVIRSDTRLVLVDSIVTDKKGGYIHDLTQKDFKVWEDNKEQTITSFSVQSGAGSPNSSQKHYLVLFFDNSTVSLPNQVYARQAATKFIESNAGPNKLMAVVDFGGSLRVAQNFTDDADRLKKVVSGVKFSSTSPNDTSPGTPISFTNFSIRNVLGALRNMAKGLAQVPGRKTLIFLSAGFPMNDPETISELTATIDACNRANVAIYPIDVRGLVAGGIGPLGSMLPGYSVLQASLMLNPFAFQVRGGGSAGGSAGGGGSTGGGAAGGGTSAGGSRGSVGAPGGGSPGGGSAGGGATTGRTGGGTTGSPGGTTGGQRGGVTNGNNPGGGNGNNNGFNNGNLNRGVNPNSQLSRIIPPLNDGVSAAQQVLHALASGTGGFVILNTNDLLGGLEKIGKEQDEYYIVGYTPSKDFEAGTCHTLKVKVDRGGANVRARTGYCDAKSADVLSGTPTERELEARMAANATPTLTASMQTPFFYTAPNTARVDVVLDIPPGTLKFTKDKGKFHSTMNVVGIAYLPDGGVGARFSDSVKLAFDDKKQMEAFDEKPFHYEKQFEMASGKYQLKVVFSSSAEGFGKLEAPLVVDPWDTGKFALSGIAFSKIARPANSVGVGIDAEVLEDRVPMVVSGIQLTPSATTHFHKGENGFIYAEIYDPEMAATDKKDPPPLGVAMHFLDPKTGEMKKDMGVTRVATTAPTGNPVVAVGLKLPIADLAVGPYYLRIVALDDSGHQVVRVAAIDIQQ